MPRSTTSLGQTLENDIAAKYGGRRSPSSGASAFDKGDVRFDEYLAECKTTEAKSFSFKLATWDKAKQEALDSGKDPIMFVRFFDRDTGKHRDFRIEEI